MLAGSGDGGKMIPWFATPRWELGAVALDAPVVLAVLGIALAMVWARARAAAAGLSPRWMVDTLGLAVVLGFLMGHWVDVLVYRLPALRADPALLLPWRGGISSLGMGLGVGAAFLWRLRGPDGLRYVDVATPPLLLALCLGRVGCFLGHDHAGHLTSFPLAVAYPGGARHDLGLDEAIVVGALGVVLTVWSRRPRVPGILALSAAGLYALTRFFLEFLRARDLSSLGRVNDDRYMGLTLVQILAIPAAAACGLLVLRRRGAYSSQRLRRK